jgi:hypothetical protein
LLQSESCREREGRRARDVLFDFREGREREGVLIDENEVKDLN